MGREPLPCDRPYVGPRLADGAFFSKSLRVGGLFSGIGGWELGLERAGFRIAWHCEADPFCRRVLEHHWRGVPCYDDVRTLRGCDVEPVDVLCGGFPCQDLSLAGKGAGIDGARSGLWSEFARLIGELRPRYVLVENVSALLGRGLGRVLGDLAALGYDAEWDCLPASAFGAPHQRDRIWIVAYPQRHDGGQGRARRPDPGSTREREPVRSLQVADASGARLEGRVGPEAAREALGISATGDGGQWAQGPPVPGVCGVGYGLPDWVDRIRSLGNALVPPIPEWVGARILEWERERQ